MVGPTIIDTGPLVAALLSRDTHHEWAKRHLMAVSNPLITCEAVISEAFFLLERASRSGVSSLSKLLPRGIVLVQYDFAEDQ